MFFPDELKKYNQDTNHVQFMNVPKLKKVFPIVWFNALMGVALDAKLENIKTPNFLCYKNYPWYQHWIDARLLYFNLTLKCFLNVLTPIYDAQQRRIVNLKGVSIRPRDFGGVSSLAHIDISKYVKYLDGTIKYLEKLGYKPGVSFRSAGFDWRKGLIFQ
jgi:hypothetical protein